MSDHTANRLRADDFAAEEHIRHPAQRGGALGGHAVQQRGGQERGLDPSPREGLGQSFRIEKYFSRNDH